MNSAELADFVSSFPKIMPWHSLHDGATREAAENEGKTLEAARNLEGLLEQLCTLFRADIVALYLVRSDDSGGIEPVLYSGALAQEFGIRHVLRLRSI